MFEICGEKHYLEIGVVLQERPQHVGFVPCSSLINPFPRIFKWVHDVVHVNIHSRLKRRQQIEEEMIDIAVDLCNVSRIDKQNIPGFKFQGLFEILKPSFNNTEFSFIVLL